MARDVRLIRSPISIAGMMLTTLSAVVFLIVLLADLFGLHTNPYLGIVFFILLPALFVLGLLLIPLGAMIERRRRLAGKPPSSLEWPRVDLNDPSQRRTAVAIFALTIANIVIVSLGAYKGVEYMDSPSFCGQVCHTPMTPEFVTHLQGPHARATCVDCHVGPGARGLVKAKLAGTRQLYEVAVNSFPRPIVASPDELVAASDTCEKCHSPARFVGDVTRRVKEYSNDETNTESVTTLHMHVGGLDTAGHSSGIHWHADPSNVVEYIATSDAREAIPWVRVTDRSNTVREYAVAGVSPEELARGVRRRMECTDCHNRPSHAIAGTPERAVDGAIARNDFPAMLPFVRREAVKALKNEYPSQDAAAAGISTALRDFYRAEPASGGADRTADIERAVTATQNLYRRNVFPEMKVTFGTYPNNIGHIDTPGCFRCHDDEHAAKDGKKIGQECDTCHGLE